MLVIVCILSCVSAVISAPVNSEEKTYILATVLFYKDDKGQIMVASGPVPQLTDYAIKDDILTRINGAAVKVVPIFNETRAVQRSLDILNFVKDKYDTVFVAEIPKRQSRNFIVDVWNYYWRGKPTNKVNPTTAFSTNKEYIKKINRVKLPVGHSGETINKNVLVITKDDSQTTKTCVKTTKNVLVITKDDSQTTKSDEPRTLTSADEFIPNDIYYGIQKKCVNWSDGCNLQSKNVLGMSSNKFKYGYTRPRIVQWGP